MYIAKTSRKIDSVKLSV